MSRPLAGGESEFRSVSDDQCILAGYASDLPGTNYLPSEHWLAPRLAQRLQRLGAVAELGLFGDHSSLVPEVWSTAGKRASSAPSPRGDKWYLDEMALTINKHRYWVWRTVDQDGTVLDILVQSRRDQHAAERFLHRVLDAEAGIEPRLLCHRQTVELCVSHQASRATR